MLPTGEYYLGVVGEDFIQNPIVCSIRQAGVDSIVVLIDEILYHSPIVHVGLLFFRICRPQLPESRVGVMYRMVQLSRSFCTHSLDFRGAVGVRHCDKAEIGPPVESGVSLGVVLKTLGRRVKKWYAILLNGTRKLRKLGILRQSLIFAIPSGPPHDFTVALQALLHSLQPKAFVRRSSIES